MGPTAKTLNEVVTSLLSGGGTHIPLFKVFMPKSVLDPLREVLFGGYIGEGPRVKDFEEQLSAWFSNENVLALNNGTAALHLALRLADVGCGDEVISTAMTCSATNEPIVAAGAKIVWADIDPWTGNIDPEDVVRKITPRTKAIMCMDWGGYPCELDKLSAIAAKHGIKLIEDACHAFGSTYHGKPTGFHSDFSCFSFQAIKHMTTVDGGALVCKSKAACARGRLLRWYGIDRNAKCKDLRCEADICEYGYKFHMNDVTAVIGLEQLRYVGDVIEKHRANAKWYDETLADLKSVRPLRYKDDRLSSYWLYTVRAKDREGFTEHMKAADIIVSQVHARNDNYSMFKDFKVSLPGLDEFTREQVSVPVGWWLTEKERAHIVNAILKYEQIMTGSKQPSRV